MDLDIYYDDLLDPNVINCWCTRWDVQDNSVIIETFLNKSQVETLQDNIVPGAVSELFTVMGKTTYYDTSFGDNALLFKTKKSPDSELVNMRNEFTGYIKTLTINPVKNNQYLNILLECVIAS
jgi:hypothetical protein